MNRTAKDYFLLITLCLVMFFLGNWYLPVTDPTESCYTETAKEMLLTGEYFSPLIYGHSWYDKPIMFYWELIAAYSLFGINDFAARFFPAIFATVNVCLTYFFGSWLYDRKRGLMGAVILITSLEYWYVAHAIITDMTLLCAMSVSLISFYIGYREKKPRCYYLAYAAAGAGMLTKGPIALCLPALIILLFLLWQRDLKALLQMKVFSGLLIFAAISSIWYLPMYLMHGPDFILSFFGVHNVLRATVSEHPELDVWYYYTLVFLAGFIPWIFPVLGQGLGRLKKLWQTRRFPALDMNQRFLLVWAVTVPVLFQSFATKYITYTLPYMVPIAILMAGCFLKQPKLWRYMAAGTCLIFAILFYTVAVPACQDYSGQRIAAALEGKVPEDAIWVNYRKGYSTSLVYYANHTVYRLVDKEELPGLIPQKMKWSTTNVMPFMAIEELPPGQTILAIVAKEKDRAFHAKAAGTWQLFKELEQEKIYLRTAP